MMGILEHHFSHNADGVEIVYPYEVNDPIETREALNKHKLNIAAINVNVKAEPEFRNGGLTSHNKEVRNKAVRFIKDAKDFAGAVGANKVTCCPLGDGYEFAFQNDYAVDEVMPIDPVADKWQAFGWNVVEIDGHNMEQVVKALEGAKTFKGTPTMIIANTVKGKGVSFMENVCEWHGKAPAQDEADQALEEIRRCIRE